MKINKVITIKIDMEQMDNLLMWWKDYREQLVDTLMMLFGLLGIEVFIEMSDEEYEDG